MDHAQSRKEELFMAIKGGKGYTTADIEALPDGERAELIDGEMFMMAPPMTVHQRILVKLIFEIEAYIRKNKRLPYIRRISGISLYAILSLNGFRLGFMMIYILNLQNLVKAEMLMPKGGSVIFCNKIDKRPYVKYNYGRYINCGQLGVN